MSNHPKTNIFVSLVDQNSVCLHQKIAEVSQACVFDLFICYLFSGEFIQLSSLLN
jgi:hypothetical protein